MTVFEQLTEYCDCLIVNEPGEMPYARFDERHVDELIHLISTYTCWAQKPCETFLLGSRREVFDVKDCVGDCDVIEFEPFYAPFDPDSFTFTLVEQNGIQETLIPIEMYNYSEADEKFRMELPLPRCECRPSCGCKSTYKVIAEYEAGYEEIPECLLPLFCEALQWIMERSQCDCEKCQDCENKYAEVNELDLTTLTGHLKDHFLNVLTRQYFRQLGLISLCGYYNRNRLWSVVV